MSLIIKTFVVVLPHIAKPTVLRMTTYQGSPRKGHRRSGSFQLTKDPNRLSYAYNTQVNDHVTPQGKNPMLVPHHLPPKSNTPYKIKSTINDNRSQVRFSIPDPSLQDEDDDRSYISISNSPQKIVFPRQIDDSGVENDVQSSIYSSRIVSANSHNTGTHDPSANSTNSLKNKLNLVDMQSKVMVDVPADIWKYHKHHSREGITMPISNTEPTHRKTQSMYAVSNPYKSERVDKNVNSQNQTQAWKPAHNRSKSLQSIIAETVKAYNNDTPGQQNANVSQSSFNETVSTISPLNIQQSTRYPNQSKKHDLFLTSESPLNKYKVSIPLEINLPPYLSPQNKQKNSKRNSLVYDGNGYSMYDEETEYTRAESESTPSQESNSISESLLGEDSLPYADNDISIDVGDKSATDADKFLGIDQDANVNLKLQYRNIRDGTTTTMPPLPDIPRERETPSAFVTSQKQTNNTLSPQNAQSNESKALEILATPSKNIVIPNLEEDIFQTPKNPSTSGSLQFFDKFEPLANRESSNRPTSMQSPQTAGKLNMSFKFPFAGLETTVGIESSVDDVHNDFVKVAPASTDLLFEARRQKLLNNQSAMSSPAHKIGHAHRRTKSIHNIDFNVIQTEPEINDAFDATSTPPKNIDKRENIPHQTQPNISFNQNQTPAVTLSPPMDKTEESIVLLSERLISPVVKHNGPDNVRPLSSFQSFNSPVAKKDIEFIHAQESINISAEMANNKIIPNSIFNALSPRRVLSNNESNQSSSVTSYTNSQFSKNSYNTNSTDVVAVEQEYLSERLKMGKPQNDFSFSDNDTSQDQSLEIIREVKDGKEVEVVVLDDSDTSLIVKPKKTKTKRHLRSSRRKDYDSLLSLCDDTASQAKDIIYRLVSETDPLLVNDHLPRSPIIQKDVGAPNNQRDRYLKKFNRTLKVKPSE